MPMSGNTYVAPTWVDNAPPAISASELQAMCDAIVNNQGDIASLNTAVAGIPNVQIVSYVGTGTYGPSNPCSITADFPIKSATLLGFVVNSGSSLSWAEPKSGWNNVVSSVLTTTYQDDFGFNNGTSPSPQAKISSDSKTITWYNFTVSSQLNVSGYTYYFLCIG